MEQVNYNSGEVLESLNNKLDRDFNNMAVNSVNFAKYSNNVTNCITEIPQDIKLELVDGTLTLKAGSKIRIPNGKNSDDSLKFDEFIIETDIGCNFDNTNQKMVFFHPEKTTLWHCNVLTQQFSGDTQPTISWGYWYDIKNNIIKHTNNGSDWTIGFSLPLCIATGNNNGIVTSIDQVFNGFGYIGSTVFALPNVKGLIPNGRNEDGSLKNIEYTTQNVLLYTFGQNWSEKPVVFSISKEESEVRLRPSYYFFEQNTVPSTIPSSQWLNTESNLLYQTYSDTVSWSNAFLRQAFICGSFFITSDAKVSNFNCKKSFYVIDHNDGSWLSSLCMPSDKYMDLTLGASGSKYTAPANGWFFCRIAPATSGNSMLVLNGNNMTLSLKSTNNGNWLAGFIPIKKGKQCIIDYDNKLSNSDELLRFIYAEGER